VFYGPGKGAISILKLKDKERTAVYEQSDPGSGIGGFDLCDHRHLSYTYDYDGLGMMDHIVLYGPGTGICWILKPYQRGLVYGV
jgi:hypothetical protein